MAFRDSNGALASGKDLVAVGEPVNTGPTQYYSAQLSNGYGATYYAGVTAVCSK